MRETCERTADVKRNSRLIVYHDGLVCTVDVSVDGKRSSW